MNVLVTGGSGFIGSAVRAELRRRGHTPVVFDTSERLDVLDRSAVQTAVHTSDAVIHLAGVLGTAEAHDVDAATVNILGALHVAQACHSAGVPMVQIGTGHKGQPNAYAITKACAEELLLARAQWTGQPINVVRAFHAYGPGQKAFPPHGPSTVRKIVPSFVCRALTGMPLEINGDGAQVIDLVHVDDVARHLVDALDGPYGRTFESGTGKPVTVLDAARDVIDWCDSPSTVVCLPMRQGEPAGAVVVATNPEPCTVAWPDGLADTVPYYRNVVGR